MSNDSVYGAVMRAMNGQRTWYEFRNAGTAGAVDIYINGPIGFWGVTADDFIRDLQGVSKTTPINVHINSPGGEVFDGVAIWSYMAQHEGHVTALIESLAGSIASVFAMAANTIKIAAPAMMMIHNPATRMSGEAKHLREMADVLDVVKESIQVAYARTGLEAAEISRMMDETTWMSAARAVELGFADEVFNPTVNTPADALSAMLNHAQEPGVPVVAFNHVPQAFHDMPKHVVCRGVKISEPAAPAPAPNASTQSGSDINDEDTSMSGNDNTSIVIDRAYLDQNHADLVAQIRAEGAQAERDRVQNVLAQGDGFAHHRELIDRLAFDGATDAGAAAQAVLAAERTRMAGHAANLADDAADVPVVTDTAPPPPKPRLAASNGELVDDGRPLEERIKEAWDASPDLRAEYEGVGGFDAWEAYAKQADAGNVRIFSKN